MKFFQLAIENNADMKYILEKDIEKSYQKMLKGLTTKKASYEVFLLKRTMFFDRMKKEVIK